MNTTSADNVLVTVSQAAELFSVPPGTIRGWIAEGSLVPVRREGRGRGGACLVQRGAVASLVYAICSCCGNGFKRVRSSQRFCSTKCRQRAARAREETSNA